MLIDTPNLIQWTDPADAAFTIIGIAKDTNDTTVNSFGTAIRLLKPLDLSVWLTAQRPALDASGHIIGFASDTGQLELWDGVKWSQVMTTTSVGALNGVAIGPVTPSTGAFTTLSSATSFTVPALASTPTTAGSIARNTGTGRFDFGIGGSVVNHVRLSGDTMTGALAMGANALSGSNLSFTGGTLAGLTWSGGTFSGTIAGNHTYSGVATFSSNIVTSGISTFGGSVNVGSNTVGQLVTINGPSSSTRAIQWSDAGTRRWQLQLDSSDNFNLQAYDATGAFKGTAITLGASGASVTFSPVVPALAGTAVSLVKTSIGAVTGSFTNNPYLIQASVGSDVASTANGARLAIGLANYSYSYGGTGHEGGRTGVTSSLTQAGITDANNGDGSYTPGRWWVDHFFPSGGTSTTATGGFVYGGNWKPVLHQGAQFYGVYNGLGEVDMAVEGSSRLVTVGGTVTAGDTLSLTFTSTSIVGSPLTVSATAVAGDTTTALAAKLASAVLHNDALNVAQVGVSYGSTGAPTYSTPTLSSMMLVFAHWIGLTVSSSVGGAATETITIGSETAGASTNNKFGVTFPLLNGDGVRGILPGSTLIAPGNAFYNGSANGWEYIIGINTGGGAGGNWPLSPHATFIGFQPQVNNVALDANSAVAIAPARMFSFVDFRGVNFTLSSGSPLLFPNFHLDGTGVTRIGGGTLSPVSTGLAIDAQGYFGSSVSLNSGGTGAGTRATYFIGDVGYDAFDGQYQVTAVNGSGVITAFTVLVNPTAPAGSAPATSQAVTGGSGLGWSVNVTWTAGSLVSVGSSAVGVVIGKGSAGATTDTSGHLLIPFCAGAPTGIPASSAKGIALRYDTTNHKLWAYDNAASAWKGVALV